MPPPPSPQEKHKWPSIVNDMLFVTVLVSAFSAVFFLGTWYFIQYDEILMINLLSEQSIMKMKQWHPWLDPLEHDD